MSTQYLSMAEARELLLAGLVDEVCLQMEQFASKRSLGLSVRDSALAVGIPVERGKRFDLAISTLIAVLKTSEAAPASTGTARQNPEGNHTS